MTRVQLGGELKGRSILGGERNRLEGIGMWVSIVLVGVLTLSLMRWWWAVLLCMLLLAATFFVWTPRPSFGHKSIVGMFAIPVRWRRNRRMGTLDSAGGVAAQGSGESTPHLPAALGRMRAFEIELWPGRPNPGRIAVLRHRVHNQTQFTMVVEFRGQATGVVDTFEGLRNHAGWARFQAAMARQGSLVRHLQQVARVVPFDPADHVHWMINALPERAPELLVRSYAELVDTVISQQEQNRTWAVFGVPASREFYAAADRVALPEGLEDLSSAELADVRTAFVLGTEMRRAFSAGRASGMSFRPLDEQRLAAVTRSLQDPDQPLDRLEDADRYSMWLPWTGSTSHRYVVIEGAERPWYTKTAIVPRDGFAAGELPVDMLVPLLTGVSPAVVRTVSTHMTLVPSAAARAQARDDVTMDTSSVQQQAGQVSDGTSEAQISASQARLRDLQPGSGVHGAEWAMAITIQAPSLDALEAAVNGIEEAAAESHIAHLTWQDYAHHLAMTMTLPLAAGVKRRKRKLLSL
ncbi:MAG: SCO6880 family protein [Brevibacterium yomogidense]